MTQQTADVDRFLTTLDHPLKDVVYQLRALILAADPGVTEQIKWKAPSFCYQGDDRVTMKLYPPDRIELVFHRGVKVKDATSFAFEDKSGLLRFRAPDRATVAVQSTDQVQAQAGALTDVVRRWMHATT